MAINRWYGSELPATEEDDEDANTPTDTSDDANGKEGASSGLGEDVSYADLQAAAKAAGIPANQSKEALIAALGGDESDEPGDDADEVDDTEPEPAE